MHALFTNYYTSYPNLNPYEPWHPIWQDDIFWELTMDGPSKDISVSAFMETNISLTADPFALIFGARRAVAIDKDNVSNQKRRFYICKSRAYLHNRRFYINSLP